MDFYLDRELPVSLIEQIEGQISYGIALGKLSAGTPLPSVRELAKRLNVASMTVARVYQELTRQGLLVTRPRLGTYVADLASLEGQNIPQYSRQSLSQIVDNCLRQALIHGYTIQETREVFLEVIKNHEIGETQPHLVLVGNFLRTTQSYALQIERILADLNIKVFPTTVADLRTNFLALEDVLKTAKLTITLPTRLQDVRELLGPEYSRLVAVAFHISKETRNRLAALPHSSRLGIVSTYPDFLQTMINEVALYALVDPPPICAVLGHDDVIREMMPKIDVLIYASGSEDVLRDLPVDIRAFEFLHEPVQQSVNRLRAFIVPASTPPVEPVAPSISPGRGIFQESHDG
jgi:DNA-binding transcriptional regulator YhcF (GntR family)